MAKQVIVLRKDLNMRKGKMAAQAAHASMKVLLDRGDENDGLFSVYLWPEARDWVEGSFTKVVLGCNSEEELRKLYSAAQQERLPCSFIMDAGKTEFNGVPTPTCIAIGPADEDKIDKITGHLKLL